MAGAGAAAWAVTGAGALARFTEMEVGVALPSRCDSRMVVQEGGGSLAEVVCGCTLVGAFPKKGMFS